MNDRKLDMSLDDIIRMEGIKGPRRFSRTGGRGGGGGGGRRFNNYNQQQTSTGWLRSNNGGRSSYPPAGNRQMRQHPYQRNNGSQPMSSRRSNRIPATLHISNLATNVTSEDLNELFSAFGMLNHAFVHYDRYGVSLGTGEVQFERKDEAIAAQNKYTNVPLDGKPMKITMINVSDDDDDAFTSFLKSSTAPNRATGGGGRFGYNRNDSRNNNRSSSSSFNNNNNNNNNKRRNITAEDLDRELDEYRSKNSNSAMMDDGDLI